MSGQTHTIGPFPASMSTTEEDHALLMAAWTRDVRAAELEPVPGGKIEFKVAERAKVDPNDPLAAYDATDDETYYVVVGPVRPVAPLRAFTPSRETVEHAAKTLFETMLPSRRWANQPAHVKNHYAHIALAALSRAGLLLSVDVLGYVADNDLCGDAVLPSDLRAAAAAITSRMSADTP